ncbi:MAG: hypothetical protein WC890_06660 [Candidatus Margulisiibacteriota bacterium]
MGLKKTKTLAILFLITAIIVIGMVIVSCGSLITNSTGFSLTYESTLIITPNDYHKTASFCRIFYVSSLNKFYVIYCGIRQGTSGILPTDTNYAWREYDANLQFTGRCGTLEYVSATDYAAAFDGDYFYMLNGNPQGYFLAKYDLNFNRLVSTVISWDSSWESGSDQMMNYTNGKLYLSTLYDSDRIDSSAVVGMAAGTSYPHMFIYNTSLEAISDFYLTAESNIPSGASVIYTNSHFFIVTTNVFPGGDLYAYKYDSNWNYLDKTFLAADGQWSQGLIMDNNKYYVAYHVGRHGNGNVAIGVYDSNWNNLYSKTITNYQDDYNAQRPWLIKVGNKVYISYDVDALIGGTEEARNWQGYIDVYRVNE